MVRFGFDKATLLLYNYEYANDVMLLSVVVVVVVVVCYLAERV